MQLPAEAQACIARCVPFAVLGARAVGRAWQEAWGGRAPRRAALKALLQGELVRPSARTALHLAGRNGMHKYNNQDHSMLAAMTAVENIINGIKSKDNIWEINTEEEYHETK